MSVVLQSLVAGERCKSVAQSSRYPTITALTGFREYRTERETGGEMQRTYDRFQSTVPSELLSRCLTEHVWDQFCSIFYVVTQPILCIKVEA